MTVLTRPQPPPNLLACIPTMKQTLSIQQEDTAFHRLSAMQMPDREINDLLNLHDSLTLEELMEGFEIIMNKMTRWLEAAHLAVFTLEQNVKEDASDIKDTNPLESAISRMEPMVAMLIEVGEVIEEKYDNQFDDEMHPDLPIKRMSAKVSITKVQSEWSGLRHFLSSVKKQMNNATERKELTVLMEKILLQVDDLSTMIFQFQERRHAAAIAPPLSAPSPSDGSLELNSPLSTTSSFFSASTSTTNDTERTLQRKDDEILMEIDSKVEPLFNNVEQVYTRMTSSSPPQDASGVLTRKHHMVQERWECLRIEIDELKDELKEDRWLAVFRQVADQVDVMIDGLDKTMSQCFSVIQQMRDWQASQAPSIPQPSPMSTFDKISKTILRTFPKSNTSILSTSSSGTARSTPPVDREKLKSVEKNFEAKYKYYTPSIDKMLAMLGNGISSRVGRDNSTTRRHQTMVQRWSQLKEAMDELRAHDLSETLKSFYEPSAPPSWQNDRSHSNWKGIRYRASEQSGYELPHTRARSPCSSNASVTIPSLNQSSVTHQDDSRRTRSVTPNLGNYNQSKNWPPMASYGRTQRTASPLSFARDNTYGGLHPTSTLRPSSSDSSSAGSSSPSQRLMNGRRTKTPTRPAWSSSTKTDKQDFSSLDPLWRGEERANGKVQQQNDISGRKSRVPRTEDKKEASWMKPTKSTMRKRAQSVDRGTPQSGSNDLRPKTPVARSKTPNPGYQRSKTQTPVPLPSRPKSSLGRQQQHLLLPHPNADRNRAPSPVRRTGTPSLIPRPKTPSSSERGGFIRASSPSLIPRPRSSMLQTPPVPPLPSNARQSNALLQVVSPNDSSDDSHFSSNSFLSVPHSPSPVPPNNKASLARQLRKKHSTPALMQRTASPSRPPPMPQRTAARHHGGYYSEDDERVMGHSAMQIAFNDYPSYLPDPKDPLDIEVANIVNASPIAIKCQKGPHADGRYYFGNELNPSLGGGKKMYACKLMSYADRERRTAVTAAGNKVTRNKVLVRVGGGWQDLEMFLLEHASLMTSDVVVRSFVRHQPTANSTTRTGWRN
ncbi:hypothetical protein DFQ28_008890 [Apophysomyces sp. BC1034]|nr:hypothetical protein DFQ30_005224 [Apophysomyces sp. BC1015]KAG0183401.1 hypothetical protein DFQ29_005777 [Apophysomyces sp. BC1021]KAG0194631.1 hypothetical protein DFQ28_008890 [Apophysomyces sp. BC1034]